MPDSDIVRFLKVLTFLNLEEIDQTEGEMKSLGYVPNTARRRLAREVTQLVHGGSDLQEALKATEAMRPGAGMKLDWKTIEGIAEDVPSCSLAYGDALNLSIIDVSASSGLLESKRIKEEDIVDGKVLLLSAGKKNKAVVGIS